MSKKICRQGGWENGKSTRRLRIITKFELYHALPYYPCTYVLLDSKLPLPSSESSFFIPCTPCCLMLPDQNPPIENAITMLGRSPIPSFICHSCQRHFHDRGARTKHIAAKHNVDQDVDALGPQESSSPSTPPNHTLLSDITVDLNPPYFDFDLESS